MNWKKLSSLFLIGTSVITLAACGNGDETGASGDTSGESVDGEVTLEFYTWGGETDMPIYQPRIDAFEEEYPNIKIDFVQVPTDYETKLQTLIAGNEAPDVVQLAENGQNFASKGVLKDLGTYVEGEGINPEETWGDIITQYTYDGMFFAMPDRGGPEILYYNKDLFDEAGLEYPTNNWSFDEYIEAAEALTVVDENGETIQYGASGLDWLPNWGSFIKSNGGSFVENGEVVVNSPENLETLKMYNDLYQSGSTLTYEFIESISASGADAMFSQGIAGMLTTGFWNIGQYTQLDELNFDIAPMPVIEEEATWPFGSAFAITEQSEHPEEAFEFIKFMTGEEAQSILGEGLNDSPAHLGVLNSEEFINREVNGKELNMEAIGISTDRIVIDGIFEGPYYSELAGEFESQVKEMLLGRLTPEEAIEIMQETGEGIMSRY